MSHPDPYGKERMAYFAGLERNRNKSAGFIERRQTFNSDQEMNTRNVNHA